MNWNAAICATVFAMDMVPRWLDYNVDNAWCVGEHLKEENRDHIIYANDQKNLTKP